MHPTATATSVPEPESDASTAQAGTAPVLLTMASYQGTLAAARCLGASGIPVTVADPALFAPARWSRFTRRRLFCPPVQEADRFLEWLLEFGRRFPGHVLYPTSDDVAFLCALHRDELKSRFLLYQPSVDVVYTLLNKRRLLQACQRAGLSTPETWFPVAAEDLRSLSSSLRYPVLVKPRTQILFWPHAKGIVATSAEDLLVRYDGFVRHTAHAPSLLAYDPDAGRPMIQAYLPEATEGIYNLSGFVDATGELSVLRASRKVLQRPRQLGVGLCFEDAEVDPDLAAKLLLLCRQLGYHGVFEAEFIEQDGRFLLIDFNPRFYGQMAFDVARESPLPLFAYLAAARRNEQLRASVQRARRSERSRWRRVYCSRLEFGLMLRLQKLAGNMRPDDLARWNGWLERHRDDLADAILDAADKGPAVAHVAAEILRFLRHPRSSLLQLASGN